MTNKFFKNLIFFSLVVLIVFFLNFLIKRTSINGKEITASTSLKSSQRICPLCDNGKMLCETYIKMYGDEVKDSNILLKSKNFYVVTDNHPVCDGHVLIVPRKHKYSYSVVDIECAYELDAIIKTLANIFDTQKYGLFEHGSNMVELEQKDCGNSIFHAHMHFIPNLEMTQKEIINLCIVGGKKQIITLKNNKNLSDCCTYKKLDQFILEYLKELSIQKKPYLFCYYSNIKAASIYVSDDLIQNGVPPQFFRRVFAEYFQKNEAKPFWNWKEPEELQRSIGFRKTIIKKIVEKFKNKEKIKETFEKFLSDSNE